MIKIFKKKNNEIDTNNDNKLILTCCLLIHAAKIDEIYTEKEKTIIIKALSNLFEENNEKLQIILDKAEIKEKESNQILDFTREIKNYDKNFRLKVIEELWKIVYSDGVADMYESNLMRRLNGLFYVSDKEAGEIKEKILKTI